MILFDFSEDDKLGFGGEKLEISAVIQVGNDGGLNVTTVGIGKRTQI